MVKEFNYKMVICIREGKQMGLKKLKFLQKLLNLRTLNNLSGHKGNEYKEL